MLERLSLTRYKGFESFSVSFGDKNILVGPNNAGKTTLISALRLCAAATSHARRRKPDEAHQDDDRYVVGYRLSALAQREAAGFVAENVRHELRDDETTRLALTFKAGSGLTIVWPSGDEEPFFYLDKLPGMNVRTAAVARQSVGEIGLVPTLVPVEHREPMVTEEHVRKNLLSRLTSRLFRNQLYYMRANRPEEFGALLSSPLATLRSSLH